jgi:tetratricopeptide (TPR) repeat protein/transcriptional regulator with XRE-family HTH domain
MSDDVNRFGTLLRSHRRAVGLSQDELAERSGLSAHAISSLERGGTRTPHRDSVHRLADALDLSGQDRAEFLASAGRRLAPEAPGSTGGVDSGAPKPGGTARRRDEHAAPRQLPAAVPGFTGRTEQLAALTQVLRRPGGTAIVSAVDGTAGVGKTALAIHWAHRAATRFPDGQLYVNLRGYDVDEPVTAADALGGFLRALGVDGQHIPHELQERAAQYRSLLAGRRILVVLDNAREAEQVRPLLPGAGGCMALVTSRDSLAGLVARDGAIRLDLDVLAPAEALALLRALLGNRAQAEPDATAHLAELCCRLPLALRIAAELATARPESPLAELAGELTDLRHRLDLLEAGADPHTAVRAVFSWSYRNLDAPAARAFRLLGLHPGHDLDRHAAAALLDADLRQTAGLLARLARAHLIEPAGTGRYGMHDLLRGYARELTEAHDGENARQTALGAMIDQYLYTAAVAADVLFPAEVKLRPRIARPAGPTPPIDDEDTARAWLEAELANLLAIAAHSAAHGQPAHTIDLAATLYRHLETAGLFAEGETVHNLAVRAARTLGDQQAEAIALIRIGSFHGHRGYVEQAEDHYRRALALSRAAGYPDGQARALNYLGMHAGQAGRYQECEEQLGHAIELFHQVGNLTGAAYAVSNLGAVHRLHGRYQQATERQQQALTLFRELGNRHGEAIVQIRLGFLHLQQDHYPQAEHHLRQALARYVEFSDKQGQADALYKLGLVDLRLGRHRQADTHLRQALEYVRELGDQTGEAEVLNSLGELSLATARPTDALARHTSALDLAEPGDKAEAARAHEGLANAYHARNDPAHARHHWQQALARYTELDAPQAARINQRLAETEGPE